MIYKRAARSDDAKRDSNSRADSKKARENKYEIMESADGDWVCFGEWGVIGWCCVFFDFSVECVLNCRHIFVVCCMKYFLMFILCRNEGNHPLLNMIVCC